MARKTEKTMTIKILGEKGTAVLIDGEMVMPDSVVTVSLDVARNLIYRERAVKADEADTKAKSK
ncbi:hypothetical protein [Desulfovibrio psychrotolerans]|uniref:Uncharacterized protein n=1 Tax=Desulfovibrio psychrotolerans TaxID=415242 RepID=A0A7J0BYQ1_9BACT|nr:hypothetical protein [Desulfovibrio psychrotolerans]GFM38315.1 hypothetical protein DSM19430T_29990 [Desulfovibrio psychrotolerans]